MLIDDKNFVDCVRDCLQLAIMEIDANGTPPSWQYSSVTKLLGHKWKHLSPDQQTQITNIFDDLVKLYRKNDSL